MEMMKRVFTMLGGLALALAIVASASAQSFSPQQTEELEQIVHDYILQHPEAIIESLRAAQAKAATERLAQQRKVIFAKRDELLHDPNSAVGGNPNGDVTLVEFFDYRCPYCKAIEPSLEALINEDGKLRVVYKEFPILGAVSVFASRAAIAAHQQGKYAAFHDRMMALRGTIDNGAVLKVAEGCGLDMTKLKADMTSAATGQIIQRDYALARALGIDATPGLVIGDRVIMGAADIDSLRQLIAAAREQEGHVAKD